MHAASEISYQNADNGAADFVIPNKAGTDQMEIHSWCSTHGGTMGRGGRFDFSDPELQHKSVVEPVFLAYN